jgi:hypothetical protein
MRKLLVLAAAICGMAALFAIDAGAMPLSPATHGFGSSDITLIRDGCGPGMRFSNSRQTCVPDDDVRRGPPGCPPGFRFSEGRGRCVPDDDVRRGPPGCPPGFRFSEGRGRCVPFERVAPAPACPPGFRFSEGRGRCVPF